MTTMLAKLRQALSGVADTVSRNKRGHFVARREFFYTPGYAVRPGSDAHRTTRTHGYNSEKFAANVAKAAAAAGLKVRVLEDWETWKPFRGSASTANSSHWGVEFTAEEMPATVES